MINSNFQKENQINNLPTELPWNLLDGESLVDVETSILSFQNIST
jgi:hypothetical protein